MLSDRQVIEHFLNMVIARASLLRKVEKRRFWNIKIDSTKYKGKLEKKYAPTLDNYGQSCFVRSDFF
jgi:hypothetical protein